jgi:hypothetical protein
MLQMMQVKHRMLEMVLFDKCEVTVVLSSLVNGIERKKG